MVGSRTWFGRALGGVNLLVYLFLLAPIIVIVASSFGPTGYLAFPPQGFSLRWYAQALGGGDYLGPFQTSLTIALSVSILATIVGTLAAIGLVRFRFPGRELLAALFLSPLMLPTLVLAVALLLLASKLGIPATSERLIAAHLVITVPYVLRTSIPVLERFDRTLEEAAQDLGAGPLATFFLVTLPIKIYSAVQLGLDPTVAAVATLLIGLTTAILLLGQVAFGVRRLI